MSADNSPERCNDPYKGPLCRESGRCYLKETLLVQSTIEGNMQRTDFREFIEDLMGISDGCGATDEFRAYADGLLDLIPAQEQTIDPTLDELFAGDPELRNEYFNPKQD